MDIEWEQEEYENFKDEGIVQTTEMSQLTSIKGHNIFLGYTRMKEIKTTWQDENNKRTKRGLFRQRTPARQEKDE